MLTRWTQRLRATFLAGFLLAAPLVVTTWVLLTLVRFLEGAVRLLPDALQPEQVIGVPLPGLGVFLALSGILLLGMSARSYLGASAIQLYERLLARVPVLSSIYHGVKQLLEAIFLSEKDHFQKVVLVQYPRAGTWALAFYTGEAFIHGQDGRPLVNVFLPTTPNPTSGFYLLLSEDEIHTLHISVEEAFKLIMSAGLVSPTTIHRLDNRSSE